VSFTASPLSLLPSTAQVAPLFGPLQLIGYVACVISFTAFFAVSQRRFLLIGATSALVWALHYHLLGEKMAAALSAISGGRNTIATRVHALPHRLRLALTAALCLTVIGLAIWTAKSPLSALPTFAACLSTTAAFWLAGRAFRCAYLVSDSCWLVFGALAGSTAGCVAAMISLSLNLWTLRRQPWTTLQSSAAVPAAA
jgi:hypothetical protein